MVDKIYLQSRKTDKHDEHELPELYLKGFSEKIYSIPSVWIFERKRPFNQDLRYPPTNPFPVSTVKATVTKERYAIINEDGSVNSNTYEDSLQVQETTRDPILRKIREQQLITQAEKDSFSGYIQIMMKRTTRREIRFSKIQDTYWKDRAKEFNQTAFHHAISGHFAAARRLYRLNKFIEAGVLKDRVFRASMLIDYKELHRRLVNLTWSFYIAPLGSYFVTSDDPVLLLGKIGELPVIFPISSEIAVIIADSNRPDLGYIQCTQDQVRVINFLIIIKAEQVISSKPDKWIYDIWENGIVLNQVQLDFLHRILGS